MMPLEKTAADFFAGIGLASAGLINRNWEIRYSVDRSEAKKRMYAAHFDADHYRTEDIKDVVGNQLPIVTLAHASFPCTDTSVAGARGGIGGGESYAFWHFVRVLGEMGEQNGPGQPPLVLVENVEGFLTSGKGHDLESALKSLNQLGYATDMLLINASHFVPQSRVRLFIIGLLDVVANHEEQPLNSSDVRPKKIQTFISNHPNINWYLRELPALPHLSMSLQDIIDPSAEWWPKDRTQYLFSQMFDRHKEELQRLSRNENWSYRTVFRRMRSRNGSKQSTAEVRMDGIAGCLRTPKGGSARQIILRVGNGQIDARLLNARENARLMGADDFSIPNDISLNEALFGFGDAVCVPVIEWIAEHYLNPLTLIYEDIRRKLASSAA
jgi:DNA (cytosine-5)-methyltransferase 1